MPDPTHDPDDPDDSAVQSLVDVALSGLRAGGTFDLDEVCRDRPELRDRVREVAEAAVRFERAKDALAGGSTDGEESAETAVVAPPSVAPPGYEIVGVLGRGGMGVVYDARQTALKRPVALKMVLGGGHASPVALVRFLAEAEAVAAIDHPHVVRVFEFGHHAGNPFLAMERLDGGSLADRLRPGVPLPPADAVELVGLVAAGVQAGHDLGIVHRDLKPANILLAADGTPKVTDFGLAKRDTGADLTSTQAAMGTPHYMAPEQAQGRTKFVGPTADVYALGAVLFACLAGRPPFEADNALDLRLKVIHDEPPSLSKLVRGVPRDLAVIAAKCLAKNPRDRYPTAAAFAEDLRRWRAGEPITARPAGRGERAARWVRRNPLPTALAAAVVLALSASVASLVLQVRASEANGRATQAELAQQRAESDAKLEVARAETQAANERAEAQRQRSVQEALANAQLALRRGELREAVAATDAAEAAGATLPPEIRIDRARALLGLTPDDLTRCRADLDALDPAALPPALRARRHLLYGEVLLGRDDAGADREIALALATPELPKAERAFAQGLIAATAIEAHAHFAAAYALDPTNLSSRLQDMFVLMSLGRFAEVTAVGRDVRLLYPDEPISGVLMALAHAIRGDAAAGARLLRPLRGQLGPDTVGIFEMILPLIEVASFPLDAPDSYAKQTAAIQRFLLFNAFRLPELQRLVGGIDPAGSPEVAWARLPRCVRPMYELLFATARRLISEVGLPALLRGGGDFTIDDATVARLADVARTHPEGTVRFGHAFLLHTRSLHPLFGARTAEEQAKLRATASTVAAAFEAAAACEGSILDIRTAATDYAITLYSLAGAARPHLPPDPPAFARSAKLLRGRYAGPAWESHPPKLPWLFATIALQANDPILARDIAESARRANPKDDNYWAVKVRIDEQLGAHAAVLETVRECRARNVADVNGELAAAEKRAQDALRAAAKALAE